MRTTSRDEYSLRIMARGSDGQMFSWSLDNIAEANLAEEVGTALTVMRDREAWFPQETFRDDQRALFSWRHRGWGLIEPVEDRDADATQ